MVIAAAGIAAAGTVAASSIGSSAQSDAIGSAQDSANATQQAQYAQARQDQMPWLQGGQAALGQLNALYGLNGTDAAQAAMAGFAASPGYEYQVQQGLRAVDQGAAARGLLRSGATLRAEQSLGTALAAQDYGAYVNRLQALAAAGGNAAGGLGQLGAATGQGIAQTDTSAAAAQASIYGNQARGLGNALTGGLQNAAYVDRINALASLGGGSAFGGSGGSAFGGSGTSTLFSGGF